MWTLRREQIDALADRALSGVITRVGTAVAKAVPALPKAVGEEKYAGWVRKAVEAAVAYDITREENILRFVGWHSVVDGAKDLIAKGRSLIDEIPLAREVLGLLDEDENVRVEAVERLIAAVSPAVSKAITTVVGALKKVADKVGLKVGDPCIPCLERKVTEAGRKQLTRLAGQGSEAVNRAVDRARAKAERALANTGLVSP